MLRSGVRILDVGTGNGVVAMIAAMKISHWTSGSDSNARNHGTSTTHLRECVSCESRRR